MRYNLRPDDGPVQGPKHVVLEINTPLHYYLCFACTILYHLTVSNTAGMPQLKIWLEGFLGFETRVATLKITMINLNCIQNAKETQNTHNSFTCFSTNTHYRNRMTRLYLTNVISTSKLFT